VSLDAGKLRHRVTIQRLLRYIDTAGDTVEGWVEFATVWAAVEPLSAREFIGSQAMQSQISLRVTIRYLDGVAATMRLLHGSRVYVIEGVLPDKESGMEYLTLPCSQGPSEV
jgi:SPP1 family predicted phage head-tail adaptor